MRAIHLKVRVAPVRARRFEPWWPCKLRLLKFFNIIIIIIIITVIVLIIIIIIIIIIIVIIIGT